jgi:hypothetical protein
MSDPFVTNNLQEDLLNARMRQEEALAHAREQDRKLTRVTLVAQALWEIISERFGLSETELLAKMREVEKRRGTSGEQGPVLARLCANCARPLAVARPRCIYCNAEAPRDHIFE